jgi:hypothetical protein
VWPWDAHSGVHISSLQNSPSKDALMHGVDLFRDGGGSSDGDRGGRAHPWPTQAN